MPPYTGDALVLRTYKLGEADRIVSILTRRHGKVRAVAKGVRKTKSRFGARLEPPTHIQLQLYEGRSELHIIDSTVIARCQLIGASSWKTWWRLRPSSSSA